MKPRGHTKFSYRVRYVYWGSNDAASKGRFSGSVTIHSTNERSARRQARQLLNHYYGNKVYEINSVRKVQK